MASAEQLAVLTEGVEAWNAWRDGGSDTVVPDLASADLRDRELDNTDLHGADLRNAVLTGCSLRHADLQAADLTGADLSGAKLEGAVLAHAQLENVRIHGGTARGVNLNGAQAWGLSMGSFLPDYPDPTDLTGANLNRAWLPTAQLQGVILDDVQARDAVFEEAALANVKARRADFSRAKFGRAWLDEADISGAILAGADLSAARMRRTNLSEADLRAAILVDTDLRDAIARGARLLGANLAGADLRGAQCDEADLSAADLTLASLVGTSLERAKLSGARIYGASAWSVDLDGAAQDELVITPPDEPTITVDDLEVAQFVYLMLDNRKIRNVLDTVTSKTVLILGRFTADRKSVLNAIRDHLRECDLVSIIFDFDPSAARNLTETITLLARMARFVVADLTDPSSVPHELNAIVSEVSVPVQPVIEGKERPYAMFADLLERDSVLDVYRYDDASALLVALSDRLLPALEEKRRALADRRAKVYAELEEST